MTDRTEDIANYLSDRMSQVDRAAFENELAQNEVLRKDLELQRKLGDLLEESERLKLRDRIAEINGASRKTLPANLIKVAAVLVVSLVASYFFIGSRYTDTALAAHYDAIYPDLITSMGESTSDVQKAMELYNSGNYPKAAMAFKDLRSQNQEYGLEIYEVVSLRKNGQWEEAIALAQKMLTPANDQSAAFEWQLILCYLADGNEKMAKMQLKHYLDLNHDYKKSEAQQLLKDLNSLWR